MQTKEDIIKLFKIFTGHTSAGRKRLLSDTDINALVASGLVTRNNRGQTKAAWPHAVMQLQAQLNDMYKQSFRMSNQLSFYLGFDKPKATEYQAQMDAYDLKLRAAKERCVEAESQWIQSVLNSTMNKAVNS
jgi:hypothetical protein